MSEAVPDMSPIQQSIIEDYRAWNEIEGAVDCDLLPRWETPIAFTNRLEVADQFRAKLQVLPVGTPPLVAAKLRSSVALIEAQELADKDQQTDFKQLITDTLGYEPRLFDESELEATDELLRVRLSEYGLGWDESFRKAYKAAAEKSYEDITDEYFYDESAKSARLLGPILGTDTDYLKPGFESDIGELWHGATYTNDEGLIVTEINKHEHQNFTDGITAQVTGHEQTLVKHLKNIGKLVVAGEIDPSLGITTTHSHDLVHLETLAMAAGLVRLQFDEDNPAYVFHNLYVRHAIKVRANGGYMINDEKSVDDVEKYIKGHLPFEPTEDLRMSIEYRRDFPKLKVNQAAYPLALEFAEPIVDMKDKARQQRILRKLFSTLVTTKEVAAIIKKTA